MTEGSHGAGTLAEVECLAQEKGWTLVFVQELRHPPETVWRALTDPAELDRWSPFTASRSLDAPGGATLTMIDGDTREDLAVLVTRVERPHLLEYTWGGDLLRWEAGVAGADAGALSRASPGGRAHRYRAAVAARRLSDREHDAETNLPRG